MRRLLFIFITLLCCDLSFALASAQPLSFLAGQLQKAKEGDYIVTQQSGNYSLLFVQACENERLLLQEISIPEALVNLKTMQWQKWLSEDAPGHTSWIIFEMDLHEGCLQESFDISRHEWLHVQNKDHLLGKLLHLPLRRLSESERRRIGPPPQDGEADHRAVWQPPQVLEGAVGKNQTAAWRTVWPDDDSPLAGSQLDLYYDSRQSDFPFPVSIDIQSVHYKAHLRVVKAGRQMQGPRLRLPRRPPEFLTGLVSSGNTYTIRVKRPAYYKNFQLFALPTGAAPIALPFRAQAGEGPEEFILTLSRQDLEPLLKKGERYRLLFSSPPFAEGYAEADTTFLF